MSTLFDERAVRYMTDLIRDFQFEDYQAAGFPGNFGEESGGFTQVQEIGPSSGRGGLGDGQWTGPRRRDFEAWLARRAQMGLSPAPDDYDANYSMLFRELDGGEGKRVLPKLRQASSVEEATEIVMLEYERPAAATAHLDVRKDYAKKALAAFRARGIDVAALKASGRPGAAAPITLPSTAQLPALQTDIEPQALQGLVMGFLALLQRKQADATGKTPDVLSLLSGLMTGMQQPAAQPVPPIIVTPPPPKTLIPPSVGIGLSGLLASLGAMATNPQILGTPLGMGQNPSVAGNLVPLAFGIITTLGASGVFGPAGAAIGRVLGVVGPALLNRQPPPPK